jgi:lipid II:glycine glycyltransferase (peptidoglycan interpeptide bridge formation enzyme)
MTFQVVEKPSDTELAPLQESDTVNPFASTAYIAARRQLGATVLLFTHENGFAVGYIAGNAVSRYLEIPSAPALSRESPFWTSVLDYCHQRHVAELEIGSYGARAAMLPTWNIPAQINERVEWVIALSGDNATRFASNHRRNINKARKLGITATSTTEPAAIDAHRRLMAASMQRRLRRGEAVPTIEEDDTRHERALLAAGAARLHQAVYQGNVLSSLLVLDAPAGAYYQSAGTAPEGMESGASTFLVSEVIRKLTEEGRIAFNLGGAGAKSEGLQRFKSGFGAQPVPLEAAVYHVASPLHKKLRAAAQLLRDPVHLPRSLIRRIAAM